MPNTTRAACAALAILGAACTAEPRLDTRTFTVEHRSAEDVARLVEPYVFHDRAGAPGTLSITRGALTVRETPDNLERVAALIREYDVARPDVRLRFQIIEADGFTDPDPRIADVTEELAKLFQFRGYRLAGEALVTATDGARFSQTLSAGDGVYRVEGGVFWVQGSTLRLDSVELFAPGMGTVLTTTVNIRPGQTLVLGSSSTQRATSTLLLTVTASST